MVAERALRRLRLDQVWLMVSPGNPLKPAAGMGRFADRIASARRISDGRRIVATGIEAALRTRYTADTLRALRRRFPLASFVWLMGADNLEQLPRWKHWMRIVKTVPFAVMPRPTYNHGALACAAARRLHAARRPARFASVLSRLDAPAWIFLPGPQHAASATAIRLAAQRGHSSEEPAHRQEAPNRSAAGASPGRAAPAPARPGSGGKAALRLRRGESSGHAAQEGVGRRTGAAAGPEKRPGV